MKLDISCFSFLSRNEYRVLTAIEMGMRNHEYLSVSLISSIANLRKEGIVSVLKKLLKNKLISHQNKKYDGYKLTYLGYDFLALRTFLKRGILKSIGNQIGVGKESDIYICKDVNDNLLCLKIHRLGRISFRTIKNNRDYYGKKCFRNWLYLSRIAATKEYAYLKALYENKFPVPKPHDINRHMIIMSYINGYPLSHVKLNNPYKVIDILFNILVKFAKADIIHGDYNEFNILIDDDENVTIIDFPQIVSLGHANAKMYFERDIKCVINHFFKKYKIKIEEYPLYEDVVLLNKDKLNIDQNDVTNQDDNLLLEVLQNDKLNYSSDATNNLDEPHEQHIDASLEKEETLDEYNESTHMFELHMCMDNQNKYDKDDIKMNRGNINDNCDSGGGNMKNEEETNGGSVIYEKREDTNGGTSIFEKEGDKRNDSILFEKEGDKRKDSILFEKEGDKRKDGILFEKEGDKRNDSILFEKEGDKRKDGIFFEKEEDTLEHILMDNNYEEKKKRQKEEYIKKMESISIKQSDNNNNNNNNRRYDKCGDNSLSCDEIESDNSSEMNNNDDTDFSSSSSDENSLDHETKKLSDTWKPHLRKYTKEYVKNKLKYMYRKKKSKEKFKENLKTKNKKKVMEKIKNYL
ncbi:serine/threonine protein kinase RIO2 [Plasmodium gaboni]|uniref:Serine/threonine-protein kinase RIO2 n=1 Tax=Plasmodium gaboni TaxID=647221 RepID=A0A151LUN9_9APIC|nr:serine/threonine protein kinase RIO2 [Plasmodium gaboni]KYO02897.1 serine/threonine protein kinase RIO2 [Plasmodium gaboni]